MQYAGLANSIEQALTSYREQLKEADRLLARQLGMGNAGPEVQAQLNSVATSVAFLIRQLHTVIDADLPLEETLDLLAASAELNQSAAEFEAVEESIRQIQTQVSLQLPGLEQIQPSDIANYGFLLDKIGERIIALLRFLPHAQTPAGCGRASH